MLKRLIVISTAILMAVGCSKRSENFFVGDIESGIVFSEPVKLSGEKIHFEENDLLGLYDCIVTDSLIIGKYFNQPFLFQLFDKETRSSKGDFIYEGRGDGEFTSAVELMSSYVIGDDGECRIFLSDVNVKKMFEINVSQYINAGILSCRQIIEMPYLCFNPELIGKERVIAKYYNLSDHSLYLTIINLNTLEVEKEIKLNQYPFAEMFGNETFVMSVKPDGKKIAMACMFMNQIMILDVETGENQIYTTEKRLSRWSSIRDRLMENEVYLDIKSNDNNIFALKNKLDDNGNVISKFLEVYDWNGNPIKQSLFTESPHTIFLDKGSLYAVTPDEEVWVYNIE